MVAWLYSSINGQLMLLIDACIHRAKRQVGSSGAGEGDAAPVKKSKLKKTSGFGNFDNW